MRLPNQVKSIERQTNITTDEAKKVMPSDCCPDGSVCAGVCIFGQCAGYCYRP